MTMLDSGLRRNDGWDVGMAMLDSGLRRNDGWGVGMTVGVGMAAHMGGHRGGGVRLWYDGGRCGRIALG